MKIIKTQSGFSLLEILVAMAIMAILGGIMAVQFIDKTTEASMHRIKGDLATLDSALIQYHVDNFMLPTTEQGLEALVSKPNSTPIPRNYSKSGYISKLGTDPWGNEYQYMSPGEFGEYDIFSLGQDGEVGGDGPDRDIGNWNIDQVIKEFKSDS